MQDTNTTADNAPSSDPQGSSSAPQPEQTAPADENGNAAPEHATAQTQGGQAEPNPEATSAPHAEEEAHDNAFGKTLDQSEIDSLLGNTFTQPPARQETGMERVIKAGFVAYERLPMLEIIFDRLVRLLSTTLRSFTNDNVEITIEDIRSIRFGDYMSTSPSSTLFAVFKATQWENYGLVAIDPSLSYSIIDILMGGQRGHGHTGTETRPHTAIERALIEKMVTLTLNDLSSAFSPVCAIDFVFERLEVSSRFAAIARASNAVVATKLHIDMEDRNGSMVLVIPYATLEPVRDQLSQQFMGEHFGRDSIWEDHLISEILETDAQVSAILEEKVVPLSCLLNLKPGSQIAFPHTNGTPFHVKIQCGQTPLFEGRLGRLRDKTAVKIERRLVPPADPHTHYLFTPEGATNGAHDVPDSSQQPPATSQTGQTGGHLTDADTGPTDH